MNFDETDSAPAPGLWRGTSRAERDEARRDRLLDAALELYGTVGFRHTSVQALCQESGVSSRSFYELFSAQEPLLERLYIVLNEEITAALAAISVPQGVTLLEAGVHIVSAALMPMLDDERKARVLEVESVGVSESLEERRRETMLLLAASVDSAVERVLPIYGLPAGRDRRGHENALDLTSLVLVGGITEALVQRVRTPAAERRPTGEFLTEIAEVILRAHGASEKLFDSGESR